MSRSAILETAFVFFSLEIGIWFLAGQIGWLAYLFPLLPVLLHWYKNPREFKNNFRPAGTERDYLLLYLAFLFFWRAIVLVGEIWNPSFFLMPRLPLKMFKSILFYLPWAFFQQLMLNGYFCHQLRKTACKENAVLISGILFSLVHLPNPALLVITLIGGWLSAYFFQQNKNLYWLALFHAVLAVSVKYCFPEAWHHNLRIGPGF